MQGFKKYIITTLIFSIFLISDIAHSQNQMLRYIFMIEATDCVSLPDPRVQTGFQLEGTPGLLTALHGVVGCNHITARQPEANLVYKGLNIYKADIENDTALLTGPSLQVTAGLKPHPTGIPSDNAVKVIGHPQAMPGLWDKPLQLESLRLQKLYLVLPPGLLETARKRNSPDIGILVLGLNGDIQPGHSGAPIIDKNGYVLGIGSGGLGDGTLGIGWAIPIGNINLKYRQEVNPQLTMLASMEPSLLFSHKDPHQPVIEPVVRSQGTGCISQTSLFDLDRGDSRPAQEKGDLFFNANTRIERYLVPNPLSSASMAVIGNRDFERVTYAALRGATYTRNGVNASRDTRNMLPPGMVIAVKTNEGRYAKLLINKSQGDSISFKWVTYALPSEGPSPVAVNVEACGPEGWLLCNSGTLSNDAIDSFRVLQRTPQELIISVRHRFNPAHGQVWLGAYLLDKDGNSISHGFIPTYAQPTGETTMRVNSVGGRSRYLFVWMYESNKSEAFICRRFDYRS